MTTEQTHDFDVVIVGGGPAGTAAGIFTARYGLDTAVFDRGRSSIQRCAHLENYPGFPAGMDIETLYGLLHDHIEEAGCDLVPDMVESVTRTEDEAGFLVDLQEGDAVTATRVIAATRYDGEYMRPLVGDEAFFTHEHDGEEHEHFDRDYPEMDGTTPVDGLYVASPAEETDRQAIIAAGRGARVALTVVDEVRAEQGLFDPVVDHYDWLRQESNLEGEWADRERWVRWAEENRPDDHALADDEWEELLDREIDRRFETYITDEAVERRAEAAHDRLLEHLDDDRILEYARRIEAEREPPAEQSPEADD
ncbi:FAD-dependent oxidoreductase [Haloarchaeobius sp. HME9146]|uniref:FAD-dependent oxidoreductase n=1 Tax=Haloarchaeobius sp. HME9146 TaxID=2978732 RepID=UPI0021C1BB50|nr:FAD-dependent oxidoreductase [Haloarchaeobius sp. HME9146]MCT9098482.1 FAD-dependent oxidoreductase [Haloarchaeobius sp. HME9146]